MKRTICDKCGTFLAGYPFHVCTPINQPIQFYRATCDPQPYKCPVCEGRGNMPVGFYDRATTMTNTGPEMCRACAGMGIVR